MLEGHSRRVSGAHRPRDFWPDGPGLVVQKATRENRKLVGLLCQFIREQTEGHVVDVGNEQALKAQLSRLESERAELQLPFL